MFEQRQAVFSIRQAVSRLAEPRQLTAMPSNLSVAGVGGATIAIGSPDLVAELFRGEVTAAGWSLTRADYWGSVIMGGQY